MLLTLSQACERAGIAVQTARQWQWRVKKKLKLHAAGRSFVSLIRQVGRVLRIDENDLEQWLEARRNKPTGSGNLQDNDLGSDLQNLAHRLDQSGHGAKAQVVGGVAAMLDKKRNRP